MLTADADGRAFERMRALLVLGMALVVWTERPPVAVSRLVHVDVVASDVGGRAVENLTPSDFELAEDGVVQTIDSVRFVKTNADTTEDENAPGGLFAFFLDEYHVSAGSSAERARRALTEFVDHDLGPHDLVAVMKPLDSLLGIRVSPDRDLTRAAINAFQGRRGDYEPRNTFEKNFLAGAPAQIEPVRAEVAVSALNALVLHLGTFRDGRKAVVLVSEGIAGRQRRRGLESLPTVETVIRSANRYNVSIYIVRPQHLLAAAGTGRESAAASEVDSIGALADHTGGQVIDSQDLGAGLRRIAGDSRAYYLLTYRSAHPADGRFRAVQVRLKRSGIYVRARKGFWALSEDEVLAAETPARPNVAAVRAAPAGFEAPRRTSPLIRPWVGVSRGDTGKTRVTFIWEPAPRVPGDSTRKANPARIVLSALAPDGTPVFDGVVLPAGDWSAGRGHAGNARAVFDVAPGRMRLQMSIEDAASRVVDSDVRDVVVRDLGAAVTLGSAEVLRARNARELRALEADPDAPPVASREFQKADRLILRVSAYAPGDAPEVSSRLMSLMGRVMRDLPVKRPASLGGRYEIDVPLASLAPGEYLIEVIASSPAGQVKDRLSFRVVG